MVVLHPTRRHGTPFPLGRRIFYIPRPLTLRPSPAYTELVEVLACATEKLSLDWPDEPRESQSSKLNERFLSGSGSCPGESCPSSLTCTMRFPGLGSRHSPLASLMRRPLTSPTLLVLWSRGTPQSWRSRAH